AALAARGHAVELAAWDEDFTPEEAPAGKRPVLTVPVCGANYVKPRTPRPAAAAPAERLPLPAARSEPLPRSSAPQPNSPPAAPPPAPAVKPEKRTVSNHPAAPPAAGESLARALQLTRESLVAVQKMQEQTANLHRQFLEGQESAQRSVQALIEQQQRLLQ